MVALHSGVKPWGPHMKHAQPDYNYGDCIAITHSSWPDAREDFGVPDSLIRFSPIRAGGWRG
jgi:hypothetical protein